MNEILHANIFFVIASIGTVIFLVLVSIILFHAIKIIKSVRRIIEKIEAGSEILASDVSNFRSQIINGGFLSRFLGLFIDYAGRFGSQEKPKRRNSAQSKKSKSKDDSDE